MFLGPSGIRLPGACKSRLQQPRLDGKKDARSWRTPFALLEDKPPIDCHRREFFSSSIRPEDANRRRLAGFTEADDEARIVGRGVAAISARAPPQRRPGLSHDLNLRTKHVAR